MTGVRAGSDGTGVRSGSQGSGVVGGGAGGAVGGDQSFAYTAAVGVGVGSTVPSYINSATRFASAGGANTAYTLPTCEAGDLIVLNLCTINVSGTPVTPEGWTVAHTSDTLNAGYWVYSRTYYRFKQNGDAATVSMSNGSPGSTYAFILAHAFADVNVTTPFEVDTGIVRDQNEPMSVTADTITTTGANRLVIHTLTAFNQNLSAVLSAPSAGIERSNQGSTHCAFGLTTVDAAAAASVAGPTWTISNATTNSPYFEVVSLALIAGPDRFQTFVVPAGTTTLTVNAYGAQGGNGNTAVSGAGGRVKCDVTVTPGETLRVYVGGKGFNGAYGVGGSGGFNGGGSGGAGSGYPGGGGGGGATDIRRAPYNLADRLVVAGGGGGGGYISSTVGIGGFPNGTDDSGGSGGDGGTQIAGGAAGAGGAAAGSLGRGGGAASWSGGGGGGLYGGGGSGENVARTGGGGGSGKSTGINETTASGVRLENGQLDVMYNGGGGGVGPPIEFVGQSRDYANIDFLYATRPAGVVAGDYMVMSLRSDLSVPTPTGWALLSAGPVSTDTRSVYGRFADMTGTDSPTFAFNSYGGVQVMAYRNVYPLNPTAGIATPTTHFPSSAGAKFGPSVLATFKGLAISLEIRTTGGVCSATSGGTLRAGTNVHDLYLASAVLENPVMAGQTVNGCSFTPTGSSETSIHHIVLKQA